MVAISNVWAMAYAADVAAAVPWIIGFAFVLGVYANAVDPVAKRMRERSE